MAEIRVPWYYLAVPLLVIVFSPVMLLSFKPHVSYDIIAVPADQPSMAAPVSPVFARAPYFIIYDMKHRTVKYVVNNFVNGTHEVGLHVAHLIVRERAGIVIGKNVGPEPFEHLTRRGVRIYAGLASSVQEALFKYSTNQLMETAGPTGFSKVFVK